MAFFIPGVCFIIFWIWNATLHIWHSNNALPPLHGICLFFLMDVRVKSIGMDESACFVSLFSHEMESPPNSTRVATLSGPISIFQNHEKISHLCWRCRTRKHHQTTFVVQRMVESNPRWTSWTLSLSLVLVVQVCSMGLPCQQQQKHKKAHKSEWKRMNRNAQWQPCNHLFYSVAFILDEALALFYVRRCNKKRRHGKSKNENVQCFRRHWLTKIFVIGGGILPWHELLEQVCAYVSLFVEVIPTTDYWQYLFLCHWYCMCDFCLGLIMSYPIIFYKLP